MTTDDQRWSEAVLAERARLIRERAELAEDLGDLLDAARQVRDALRVSDVGSATVLLAVLDLAHVVERVDDEPWQPPRRSYHILPRAAAANASQARPAP